MDGSQSTNAGKHLSVVLAHVAQQLSQLARRLTDLNCIKRLHIVLQCRPNRCAWRLMVWSFRGVWRQLEVRQLHHLGATVGGGQEVSAAWLPILESHDIGRSWGQTPNSYLDSFHRRDTQATLSGLIFLGMSGCGCAQIHVKAPAVLAFCCKAGWPSSLCPEAQPKQTQKHY